MSETLFSPCPRGLEAVLVAELEGLGALEVSAVPGGVKYRGDWSLVYRVNLESRIATRVLWRVAQGRYRGEDDLYRMAGSVPWAKFFRVDQTLRVFVTARRSPLRSLEFVTLRIKDAVCDRFRNECGRRPSVDTESPDVRIHLFLDQESASLYLDTTGEALYQRGYKVGKVEAPLKENLAAGILALSGWQPGQPLVDPMCGSGTFLLEAAQMTLGIAPGLGRRFAFEQLRSFDKAAWVKLRGVAQQRQAARETLPIFGSDIAGGALRRTRQNLEAAGLAEVVSLDRADVLDLKPPAESGVMVANLPYGVRLGEAEELAAFYPRLGSALKQHWAGWTCCLLSGDEALAKGIGLRAGRRTPLFNGSIACRLYAYQMISGSMRRRPAAGAVPGSKEDAPDAAD